MTPFGIEPIMRESVLLDELEILFEVFPKSLFRF